MSWLIIVFVILIVFYNLQTFFEEKVNKTFKYVSICKISINIDCLGKKMIMYLVRALSATSFQRFYLRCYRKKPVPEEDNTSLDSFLLLKGESNGRSF
jgi:hypothetical protein